MRNEQPFITTHYSPRIDASQIPIPGNSYIDDGDNIILAIPESGYDPISQEGLRLNGAHEHVSHG